MKFLPSFIYANFPDIYKFYTKNMEIVQNFI